MGLNKASDGSVSGAEGQAVATKLSDKPPSITVQFTPEDFDLIHQFAYRSGMSVAQVAKLSILRFIVDAEKGKHPQLLSEFQTGIQPGNA